MAALKLAAGYIFGVIIGMSFDTGIEGGHISRVPRLIPVLQNKLHQSSVLAFFQVIPAAFIQLFWKYRLSRKRTIGP
ncbi:hypothetical protein [Methylobacterium sp. Leaf123]|uniref:hypothetical protein n=1 Tax=Methylobacterium sp. Leaf123 TaxID=1736264 RepID=UPI000ABCEB96|nr:hypothetical protein [Methylobacterium sp. Leaf123]